MSKTAIVTGASRGIGAAIAERLASDGFAVLVNYASRADDAEKVVERIKKVGGKAIAVKADISKTNDAKKLFDEAEKAFGSVDVLVNNAGVMPAHLPYLAKTTDAEYDSLMEINVRGTFNTLREAATRLKEGGRIINLSTSVIGMRREGYSVYSATKAAVEAMSAVFAKELRGRNITVNCVAPGPTETELFMNGKSDTVLEQLRKLSPLERLGQPEDIAEAVSSIVHSEWVNGQVLRVNGGVV